MRYLSLFSGVGGFDLGFDRAGMECVGQVEYDEKARAVLARHWPDVKRLNDVREVQGDEFGTIDLICGGFPCQDVSVAGRRAGLAGERSGLWFEFHRVIDRVKPRTAIIENVPGLLSSHGGRDFAVILRGLVECGYGVAWRILDAQYFGVAQRRRRVFIVGSFGDGRAAEILFEREGGAGDIAEGRGKGAELARDVATSLKWSSGERGFPLDFEAGLAVTPYVMAHGQANAEIVKDGSPSLTLNHEAPIVTTAFNGYTGGPDDNDAQGGHIVAVPPRAEGNDGGFRTEPGEHLVMGWNGDHTPKFSNGVGLTLRAEQGGEGVGVIGSFGARRLTPVECERLQGFPDGWTESGWIHPSPEYIAECARKGKVPPEYVVQAMSDSTRYRQLGNAVAVPVAEWLGRRIMEVDTP